MQDRRSIWHLQLFASSLMTILFSSTPIGCVRTNCSRWRETNNNVKGVNHTIRESLESFIHANVNKFLWRPRPFFDPYAYPTLTNVFVSFPATLLPTKTYVLVLVLKNYWSLPSPSPCPSPCRCSWSRSSCSSCSWVRSV